MIVVLVVVGFICIEIQYLPENGQVRKREF